MRVALIRPICRTGSYDPDVQEPLGLQALAGSLRATNHTVLLLDLMGADQAEAVVIKKATSFQPDLIGFCLSNVNELDSITFLMRELAAACMPKKPVFVVGGFLVTMEPEFVAQNVPPGTVLVRYEGELGLLALAETETSAWPEGGIPGGLLVDEKHRLLPGKPAKLVDPLDCLPMAARDLTKHFVKRDHAVLIEGSRGCAGYCTYCCVPHWPHSSTGIWRGRSPEHIVNEMAAILKEFGPCAINFVDEDFLGHTMHAEPRAAEFARHIADRKLKTTFSVQSTPLVLTRTVIETLAKSGLVRVFLSLENDDHTVLRKWGKALTLPGAWDIVATLRDCGVEVRASTILFHPEATMTAVKRFADKLHQHKLLDYDTATSRLMILPGSVMYEQAKRAGQLKPDTHGEFTPDFRDKLVDSYYRSLMTALSPLQPAWQHAVRKLSSMQAWERTRTSKSGKDQAHMENVYSIISDLNDAVAKTFFGLMSDIERGLNVNNTVTVFQKENFRIVDRDISFLLKPRL